MSNHALILLAGNPGSGKSSIAHEVARQLRAAHIENDALAPLVDAGLALMGNVGANYDGAAYKELRPAAYAAAANLVNMQLQNGLSVVWAHPMQAEFQNDAAFLPSMKSMADKTSASFHPVWIYTDEETTKRRLTARKKPKDHVKLADWPAYAQTVRFGPLDAARLAVLAAAGVHAQNIANPDGAITDAVCSVLAVINSKQLTQ